MGLEAGLEGLEGFEGFEDLEGLEGSVGGVGLDELFDLLRQRLPLPGRPWEPHLLGLGLGSMVRVKD